MLVNSFVYLNFEPFVYNAIFLYSLKTSENRTESKVSEKRCTGNEWINTIPLKLSWVRDFITFEDA